ncbi:MAG TPA: pilus assembly protein PilP [Gammaproteobacteria bacterium]|nr:pilus assembly protein PilP [Gammaproteobacteria bacterium]
MKLYIQINRFIQAVICLLAVSFLSGCVSRDISSLEDQVAEIMARPGGRIEPLPEIKPYEAYAYQSGNEDARNPFKLFYVISKPEITDDAIVDDGLTEEMEREINRNREELEQFELDSLRMVGTIDNESNNWAIVLDPNGVVHRVSVGNYIGANIGKVINIYEDRVELREIVQDSGGRWEEREAALALIEE